MPDKPTCEDVYSELNKVLEESRIDVNDISDAIADMPSTVPIDISEQISLLAKKVTAIDSRLVEAFDLAAALYGHATTDGLTGFRTKAYFDTVVKPRLSQYPDIAYLMVDIDHFKHYNDSYGHPQGDEAIRSVTGVIQRVAPTDLLFRFGGEEFSVIAVGYDVDKKTAQKIAEDIRVEVESNVINVMAAKSVAEDLAGRISKEYGLIMDNSAVGMIESFGNNSIKSPIEHQEKLRNLVDSINAGLKAPEIDEKKAMAISDIIGSYLYNIQRVTVSIGGSVRNNGETIDNLIKRADDALYVAKRTRNIIFIAD